MEIAALPTLSPPDKSWLVVQDNTPPPGTLVLYRTAYYQMVGYVNQWGGWVGSDDRAEQLPVQWWRYLDRNVYWPKSIGQA